MAFRADRQTWASHGAAVLLLVLAVVQLWSSGVGSGVVSTVGVSVALCAAALTACTLLARINCFETRLLAVLVCVAQLAIAGLALTIGLPGEVRRPLGPTTAATAFLPLLVLLLVAIDNDLRQAWSAGARTGSPYAR